MCVMDGFHGMIFALDLCVFGRLFISYISEIEDD